MKLSDFDYNLPKNLIAQVPKKPRDHSRLLVFDKAKEKMEHKHFFDIVGYLGKGDVLVLNNSKVFPARLIGKKKNTGGKVEIFLHKPHPTPPLGKGRAKEGVWECMVGGRAGVGQEIEFEKGLTCEIIKNNNDGTWEVKFNLSGQKFMDVVEKIGQVPLPPYIKNKKTKKQESKDYQTAYADDKKVGSVAAPTAGFHFTSGLIKKLKKKGVQFEYITLHVGLGTFAPVKIDDITKHKMHAEYVEISKKTFENIKKAKKEKRRIITVGTTSTRALESAFSNVILSEAKNLVYLKAPRDSSSVRDGLRMTGYRGWTDIFIYPGYKFKIVDAMITNFHLPKSTLLMLVSALIGKKNIDKVYKEAIKKKYRFYSYGDAMFLK